MKNVYVVIMFFMSVCLFAQNTSGTVTDAYGEAQSDVSITVKGTQLESISDSEGKFELNIENFPATLVFSSDNFQEKEITLQNASDNIVSVLDGNDTENLQEVVFVGSKAKPRTILDSPVPIDNISVEELKNTGQPTIDKMLTYTVPSFNSTTQTISDATAHFDPADLRGLGPSRTLVLVNGKRKNQSALVYINDTPGKGEVGVDLKSIPVAALERVEVLRDGASAQYGSDAIAGVINMVLKKNTGQTVVNLNSGITTKGDGFNIGADVNTGFKLNDNGGFINLTLGYYNQDKTNRAGEPGYDALFGVPENDPVYGDWLAQNPDLGMTIGQPKLSKVDAFFNAGIPFNNKKGEIYSFGGATFRKGESYALYRTPYWITDDFGLLTPAGQTYTGFQPTFETDIKDQNFTLGTKFELVGFKADLSGTYGNNSVDYTAGNTINPSLGAASPTSFEVGGYSFNNILANLDFSRSFGDLSIAFGAEVRQENFTAKAGQEESYVNGGAQSFPGLQPSNALEADRNNFGVYADTEWDITENLLLGGAVRYENFSDFGDNTSWKVNSRYLLPNKLGAIRASYSTGFRAPTLHQIYLSNVQTLVSGGTISNQGTFNNVDPVIRQDLGIPQLTAETSKNLTAGITLNPLKKLSISLDYYNVKVDDRVLFTGEIGSDADPLTTNPVEVVLANNDITSLKFFVNAVNTETSGVDLVVNYKDVAMGSGKLGVVLAANFNETKIVGNINTPKILADNGYEIFNRKEQSRIISARPKSKVLVGLNYQISKFNVSLNNTYFGEVTWQHATNPDFDQTFSGKIITDVMLNYAFSKKLSASVSVNNLLDVYPDEINTYGDVVTDLGGRFRYPWEVNQFGFNGTTLTGGITYKF